MLQAET